MTSLEALEFWYKALHSPSPFGIVIETDAIERLRQKLYTARRDADDPTLEGLVIVTSPSQSETQLWIVKKDAADSRT